MRSPLWFNQKSFRTFPKSPLAEKRESLKGKAKAFLPWVDLAALRVSLKTAPWGPFVKKIRLIPLPTKGFPALITDTLFVDDPNAGAVTAQDPAGKIVRVAVRGFVQNGFRNGCCAVAAILAQVGRFLSARGALPGRQVIVAIWTFHKVRYPPMADMGRPKSLGPFIPA